MKTTKLSNGGTLFEDHFGTNYWIINGHFHREDGPAIEYANGNKEWFLNGEYISCTTQKQFEQLMKLKAFW
jgi:hypothetical protein